MATVTTSLLGETGSKLAATLSAEKAWALSRKLAAISGVSLADPDAPFFREFAIRLPERTDPFGLERRMRERGFLAGIPLERLPGGGAGLLIAVTEKRFWSEIEAYVQAFRAALAEERSRASETVVAS
jgi:glycine cleavage system pyridoxal-binding protein P